MYLFDQNRSSKGAKTYFQGKREREMDPPKAYRYTRGGNWGRVARHVYGLLEQLGAAHLIPI